MPEENNYRIKTPEPYDVSEFTYPVDLFENRQYGGNYLLFYINVNEDSKLYRNREENGAQFLPLRGNVEIRGGAESIIHQYGEFDTNVRSDRRASSNLSGRELGLLTAGIGPLAAGAIGLGALGISQALIVALTSGFAVDLAQDSPSGRGRQLKTLKSVIALHIPHNLQIYYKADWEEIDTVLLSGLLEVGNLLFDDPTPGGSQLKDLLNFKTITNTLLDAKFTDTLKSSELHGILANLALNVPLAGDTLSVTTGLAPNPRKEQLFRGIGLREFSYDYQFYPRSRKEAEAIKGIIKMLKYHMVPEYKNQASFLFVYPSEFDIVYYQDGHENENLHKHPSCVLTDLVVNYTPNGLFNTIDDVHESVKGMPPQINVTMKFKELAIITRDEIEAGY